MQGRAQRVIAATKTGLTWLGLATLACELLLCAELGASGGLADGAPAVLYVAVLAFRVSVLASLAVGLFHAARNIAARQAARAPWAPWTPWALLGGAVCLPIYTLSSMLVAGAWISKQPYVRAAQDAIFIALLAGWLLSWLWHTFGALGELRDRITARTPVGVRGALHAAYWIGGGGAVPAAVVLLDGILRPYQALARALLFPIWLVAATLLFRLLHGRPQLALRTATVVVVTSAIATGVTARDESLLIAPRNTAIAASGLLAVTEGLLHPFGDSALARFDFAANAATPCPRKIKQPTALALAKTQRRNVIFLSIDTMRRDAIGKRFGKRAVAPNLEAFARESIFFERATAAAPITLYSLGAAVTGHSVNQILWLPSVPKTIFTRTKKLFGKQYMVLPDWNVLRRTGFTKLVRQRVPAEFVEHKKDPTEPFIELLADARARGEKGFYWLHLVDAHAPYRTRSGFDFGETKAARYYSEIAFDDACIGRVLDYLRSSGAFEDSLIVIFSDHGESLGEGGYWGHGISMRGRFTDVPLYVRYPGVKPRVSQAPVILSAIAPTVLHFLGQSIPVSFADCSLLEPERALEQCPWPVSGVYGIGTETFAKILRAPMRTLTDLDRRQRQLERWQRFRPEIAATSGDHRYVLDLATGAELLFDRRTDQREQHNLSSEDAETVATFRTRVSAWRAEEAQRIRCALPR